ncbi:hypothetical protein HX037_10030 [Ignatzschineria indica]|uniref:hypothetical protein n=1 Tax=Ignatzschineria indica TaxID=472583 RepID=UPI002578478C|nr:hypothetical protein [Ignatzschineria indica]MDM1546203.1 hypothetical protein [Ignatzschineria indica]
MILKKICGSAGADYIALFAGVYLPIGIYDAGVISFLLLVHARSLGILMPLAGTQYLEERDSKFRQLISLYCFNESF